MTYMSYHLRLELSFLMDEFAMPPPPPGEHAFGIADTDASCVSADDTKPCPRYSADNDDSVKTSIEETGEGHTCGVEVIEEGNVDAEKIRSGYGGVDANSTICVGSEAAELTDLGGEKSPNDADNENICVGYEAVDSTQPCCDKSPNDVGDEKNTDPTEIEHVSDFSDPLHDYQRSRDESIFDSRSELRVVGRTSSHFKAALGDVALSVSPFIAHDLPYLLTDSGAKCRLRSFFPEHIFCSELLRSSTEAGCEKTKVVVVVGTPTEGKGDRDVVLAKEHVFVTQKLTDSADDSHIQVIILSDRLTRFPSKQQLS